MGFNSAFKGLIIYNLVTICLFPVAYSSHLHTCSCSPPNLSSALIKCVSHLHFIFTQNGTYIAKSVALLPLSSFPTHISCNLHTPKFYKKLTTSNQTKETMEWYSTSLGIRTPVFRKQLGLIYGITKG